MGHRTDIVSRALWAQGVFPHQFAWLLDLPLRRLIIAPGTFASRLPLGTDSTVLEVGPGSGYFSVELARRVPDGLLHLVDLQPEMLVKARAKLEAYAFDNVCYTVVDAGTRLPFRYAAFDVAVLVSVLGEIEDRQQCVASLFDVLRPGGTLAVHESVPDPDRLSLAKLTALTSRNGFQFSRRYGPGFNYTALFTRPASSGC